MLLFTAHTIKTLNSIVGLSEKQAWGQNHNFNYVALNNEGTITDLINSASQKTAPTKLSETYCGSFNRN